MPYFNNHGGSMQIKRIDKVVLQQLLQRIDSVARRAGKDEYGKPEYGLPVGDEGFSALMREVLNDWLYEEIWQKLNED
jgi:hypothetical protein